MNLPPIRYPLPTLLGLGLVALLAWSAHGLVFSAWDAVASGFQRVVEGPPVPASSEPMELAAGIPRRGLLLHEDTPAREKPDGAVAETIHQRMFVDIYDVWPLSGEPTHYRVGNRRAIGWVEAGDLLSWSTRLVRKPAEGELRLADRPGEAPGHAVSVTGSPVPVLEWSGEWVREAVWSPSGPWTEVAATGWERADAIEEDGLGVLLTRGELLELMRLLIASGEAPTDLRLRAALGILLARGSLSEQARTELRTELPGWFLRVPVPGRDEALEALGRLNDSWRPDASWESLEFAFVPLTMVP